MIIPKAAIAVLSKDPVMKKLVKEHGEIELPDRTTHLFEDLVDSIVSQQLSLKAAATIFKRFKSLFPEGEFPPPQAILEVPDKDIRSRGLSFSKIRYIKGICMEIIEGRLKLEELWDLTDEDAKAKLVALKGIGEWTAEMILMFSLGREDIFSVGDMGLKNAIQNLYGIEKNDKKALIALSEKWAPYRSWACRYLWKSLDTK